MTVTEHEQHVLHPPADHLLSRHRPILPLAPELTRLLHRGSMLWALAAVVLLEVARRLLWLDHRPGTEAFEIEARPAFLVLFAVGAVLAWRWEIIGGTLAAFTAAGVAVWQGQQLEPLSAAVVIVAFVVPGAMWVLLDLHDRTPRVALAGLVAVALSAAGGTVVASDIYDGLFGPTHPDSTAQPVAGSALDWVWVGGITTSSAVVTARMADDVARPVFLAAEHDDLADAVTIIGETDPHRVVRLDIDGLRADTTYVLAVAGTTHAGAPVIEARFRTLPAGAASFTIAFASCARVDSNAAVFDTIRSLDPTLMVIDGDLHYANIERDDPDLFRDVLDELLENPGPSALLRSTPLAYVWDDHDYGGNNADGTSPSRAAAQAVYREYVPHYPLADAAPGAVSQAFDVGRARVIMTDLRSYRDPASDLDDARKSLMGEAQQRWFERELLAARDTHALIIWVNPSPWVGEATAGADGWAGYSTERAEIANVIAEHRIDNLLMLSGDAHMLAIDDGTNTQYATGAHADEPGFPLMHAAALDRPGHTKGGPYSEGMIPGSGQFGLLEVDDHGDRLDIRLTGHNWQGDTLISYSYSLGVGV